MIDYVYTAKDLATDQVVSADVKAESPEAAAKLLVKQKLFPIKIVPKTEGDIMSRLGLNRHVSTKDRVLFTRQLATLINSGLPLAKALRSVEEQIDHANFKSVIATVVASVEGGSSLSDAFAQHPKVFNEIYIALVAAGESSGTLDAALNRLADQQEKDAVIASKIRSAMVYPAIVFVLIIGVIILMLTSVVPQVAQLYEDLHRPLPLPTQILQWLSAYMINFWWLNVLILGALIFAARKALATEAVELWIDGYKLRMPLFGILFTKVAMARFARTMGTLLATGVPMLQAMETTKRALGNRVLATDMDKAIAEVRGGKALSSSLEVGHHFLHLVPQMLAIGEESGAIDDMMARVATYYENEVDEAVKNLSTTLEPVMMVVLGGIVALMLAAVLGPVYSLVGSGDLTNTSSSGSSATTTK